MELEHLSTFLALSGTGNHSHFMSCTKPYNAPPPRVCMQCTGLLMLVFAHVVCVALAAVQSQDIFVTALRVKLEGNLISAGASVIS